ncbi:hypothetical protein VTI74DRAFT_4243 [Chaetomium olivicolor]
MESLKYAINHVFLPPRIPQEDDTDLKEEHNLISSLLVSTEKFSMQCPATEAQPLGPVIRMLQRLLKVKPGLGSSEKKASMREVIHELKDGEFAVFHIRAQNAGLLLTGRKYDILIEAFELLAPNNTVMSCEGRLVREFPDSAAAVDRAMMLDTDLLGPLIDKLSTLELEECPLARPKTKKSGQKHAEDRDTVSPFLVTDMIMADLAGVGQSIGPQRVSKRSREQVSWNQALVPFHRSPTWLLLRVALRLVLDRNMAQDGGQSLYKALTTFHHACLLEQASQLGPDSDILFTMAAKLTRRIVKLNQGTSYPWWQKMRDIIKKTNALLQERWRQAQVKDCEDISSNLANLCFHSDTNLGLQELEQHLSWMGCRSMSSENFVGPGDTTVFLSFESDFLPSLPGPSSMDSFFLLELEAWIKLRLSSWVAVRLQNNKSSLDLAEHDLAQLQALLSEYSRRAKDAYVANPEALSLMCLNIMDLWVALDRIAGKAVPLLLDYDPGFTSELLYPLILPTRTQMARLQKIEVYLHKRKQTARNGYIPAFGDFGEANSFAVRFFNASVQHQNLLDEIQRRAGMMETQKLQEYSKKRAQHDELSCRLKSTAHETEWSDHHWRDVCIRWCQACQLERDMASLKIDIFEWPLPANVTLSKAIVFEISVPRVVSIWRDATSDLFLNFFAGSGDSRLENTRLWKAADHSGLRDQANGTSQIQLASTIKPVEASHYRAMHILSVTEKEVCVRHPWYHYDYYHATSMMHHTEVFKKPCLPPACSFAEHQHGKHLVDWTRYAGHGSNEVIAAQSECPQTLNLDEFRAFGHLRSGLRLQWANILCQMAMPSLNWNYESTYFLVLQACLESGPPGSGNSVLREAHSDILDESFVQQMISALADALTRFRENWQNDIAVSVLACIATRILSLTESGALVDSLLDFLAKKDRDELGQRALMAALTCLSTFDIDSELLQKVLCSLGNLACLVEASIIAERHIPATGVKSNPILILLSHRWQRIMHRALDIVKEEVVQKKNPGFHSAIWRFWADYTRSETKWAVQCGNQSHVLEGHMSRADHKPTSITFNTLDGRLLVSGYRLSRLPREYEVHNAYLELFDTQVLEVVPSTRPGMQFSACREYQGWVVHFAMVRSELVIQAVRQQDAGSVNEPGEELCEFIPSSKLQRDVPHSFVQNYSHWLNHSTGSIEFRPQDQPWVSSSGETKIRSKHYCGMFIDEDQSIGALVGLQNKLVLREDGISTHSIPRRIVLVPRGPPSTRLESDHVSVSINSYHQHHVNHDAFTIDSTLGQMKSSGSLSSKIYLSLLHALTSHCLPDPLTGRTGTEEALRILRSASVRSFQRLDDDSYGLLCNIARLSPERTFYPDHLRNMEQTKWHKALPVLSQHDEFWLAVEEILAHARDCEVLHQTDGMRVDTSNFASLDRSSLCLSMTATTRDSGVTDMVLHQKLLEAISADGLREDILQSTGANFSGQPGVDISFNLEHLRPFPTAFKGLWCGLHQWLAEERNRYKIAFFLSTLLYAEDVSWGTIQALMAIANVRSRFQLLITPPNEASFDLDYKDWTMRDRVDNIIKTHLYPLNQCLEAHLPKQPSESKRDVAYRRHSTWESRSEALARDFASDLQQQWQRGWTVSTPTRTGNAYESYMDHNTIMRKVRTALDLARRTKLFEEYLDNLIDELDGMDTLCETELDHDRLAVNPSSTSDQHISPLGFVPSSALFTRAAPITERPQPADLTRLCDQVTHAVGDSGPLTGLLDQLSQLCDKMPYQVGYINELQSSSGSAASHRDQLKENCDIESVFEEHFVKCQERAEQIRSSIDEALAGQSITDAICQSVALYPRISPVFLFQRLTRAFWADLPTDWRECLINYGLSLAYLQRAERLVNESRRPDRRADLLKEILNMGSHVCEEGDPMTFPESLVLELEQGILIRPVQQRIAAKMREPPEGNSCVMQLNMGEGKSSVIVPIVSAALADGERLVRVVVAKPQSKQMMHTLIATLGGLINRRVFYLPISRVIRLSQADVHVVKRMLEACRKEGGVLLVQPEHLLSFKLMGLESIWAGGESAQSLGQQILSTYRQFEAESRDIVDESDENFSVKFELIYTMGTQRPIDMSPDRWTIIQELMDVVLEVAGRLENGPEEVRTKGVLFEGNKASGRFPTIRVLGESAGQWLVSAVAEQICRTGLRGFPIQHQSKQMRQAVLGYILTPNLSSEQVAAVEEASSGFFNEPATRNAILLLRGLLATGVILFALGQKRFRVNYGLAPGRQPPTMLAVPYRAKDSPAPRSDFSHPDVVIVLTCLSYYYQGLSDGELRTCLENLSTSDQAEQEYSRWAGASPQLPASLGHFSGVNLRDSMLCKQTVFPALRYTKPAIDFYLASVVFPKEMREFPWKLSASGWDLGKRNPHPLTGFSGTTDSKYVLPLSVTALDLPEQRHTNSAVLACLLRNENMVLELGGDQEHLSALTVNMLLTAVTSSSQEMRVILDVGAQIIELSNLEVAKRWLDQVSPQEADAVIFFNNHDELSVLTRNGLVDSFLTSPFATQTDRCLVFLDQAHTRGTDLKLPDFYRAAVTLGPGLTKDTLVQACMRMRKLGNGQSVTFCVSPEMQKRIRSLAKVEDPRPLTVTDILVCSIAETWDDAHRSLPLWATQGIRHQYQEVVWNRADEAGRLSLDDVKDYLENEAQSLKQRFRPSSGSSGETSFQTFTEKLKKAAQLESRQDQVGQIRAKCVEFGLANLDSMGSLQEEQERELAPEVEREQEVERPAPQEPAAHSLHRDVQRFAVEGILTANSPAFLPAFQSLSSTSAAALFPLSTFPSSLLVTADFSRTIAPKRNADADSSHLDAYQRPVQWLLTQPGDTSASPSGMHTVVIISPWEANKLKPLLETTPLPPHPRRVLLRAYLARSSLSFRTLEDLTVYTVPASCSSPVPAVPPQLVTQLNLFSGQLFLRSYAEYVRLCRYLGLSYQENEGEAEIAADGFVGRKGGKGYEACGFRESPVGCLGVLFKRVRRDCLEIKKTHMGRVLAGEILRRKDFEGCKDGEGEKREVDEEGSLEMDRVEGGMSKVVEMGKVGEE